MIYKIKNQIDAFLKDNEEERKIGFSAKANYFSFVFICGKKIENNQLGNREIIKNALVQDKHLTLLAEDFVGLVDNEGFNLLSLEEILLEISTAVIIILESVGTFCELGAFSIIDKNLDKVFVINNNIYEKEKDSFVSKGPIKKIEQHSAGKKHIYYLEYVEGQIILKDEDRKLLLQNVSKTSLKEPYKLVYDCYEIRDIGFIFWLLIDYIKTFGFIEKGNEFQTLKSLFFGKDIKIFLGSGSEKEINLKETDKLMKLLFKVGEKFDVIKLIKVKGVCYWVLNYKALYIKGVNVNEKDSLVFVKSFIDGRAYRRFRYKLFCSLKKEGFLLWAN